MKVFSECCGEWTDLGGGTRRRIRSYDDEIMAVEVDFDEGGVGAEHRHPHTQVSYCLSGRFRFIVEGKEQLLSAGETLLFPSNALHGCVALEKGRLLDVFAPMRKDFL